MQPSYQPICEAETIPNNTYPGDSQSGVGNIQQTLGKEQENITQVCPYLAETAEDLKEIQSQMLAKFMSGGQHTSVPVQAFSQTAFHPVQQVLVRPHFSLRRQQHVDDGSLDASGHEASTLQLQHVCASVQDQVSSILLFIVIHSLCALAFL